LFDELEHLLEEKVGISNRNNTERDSCSLPHLVILVLEETRNGFEDTVHLGKILVLTNLSECQCGFNLIIIWRVVALNNTEKLSNILIQISTVLGNNNGSNLGRGSLSERNLVDQVINFFLADNLLLLRLNEEILELDHDWLSMNLGGASELDSLHEDL